MCVACVQISQFLISQSETSNFSGYLPANWQPPRKEGHLAVAEFEKGGSEKPELGSVLGVTVIGNFRLEKKCAVKE